MQANYSFTSEGVRSFLDDVIGDVMDAIHETGTYEGDAYLTIGSRTIALPMIAETYEAIDEALHDAIDIWESEYLTEEEKENA